MGISHPTKIRLQDRTTPTVTSSSQLEAYRSELDRLLKLGIITDVREYSEWLNSIVLVNKPDDSLRLCLDKRISTKN